jgi:hypothetical protein
MTTPESALQRCLDAFNQANAREDARNDFSPEALARVHRAWRRAMPILTPDNLDAFIACVTQGLIYQVFPLAEASKLLYAAQVTLGLLRARREAARQQPKSESKLAPTPSPLEGGEAAIWPHRRCQPPALPCPIHGDSFIVPTGGRPRTPANRTGTPHPPPPATYGGEAAVSRTAGAAGARERTPPGKLTRSEPEFAENPAKSGENAPSRTAAYPRPTARKLDLCPIALRT